MSSFYYNFLTFSLFLLSLSSCSVLIGQVKPVEQKSQVSTYLEIEKTHKQWKKVDDSSGEDTKKNDLPDFAWQSTKTSAIISFNSACRQKYDAEADLAEISSNLLSQFDELKILSQKYTKISGFKAIETTAHGTYLNQKRKLKTIIVKSHACVYDIVYLSPVKSFNEELGIFNEFRDSLNLK